MSDKVINFIGAFTLVGFLVYAFKKLDDVGKTELVNEEGLKILQNNSEELDKAIEEYKENGEWKSINLG